MDICLDIETAYIRGSIPRDYDNAWDRMRAIEIKVRAATAYFPEENKWRSYGAAELGDLCSSVALADRIITFNGKLWDIPILSKSTVTDEQEWALKALCGMRSSSLHDDIYQIACEVASSKYITQYGLAVLNLGEDQVKQWDDQIDSYRDLLKEEGWPHEIAYQAAKAWKDVKTTYALWQLWQRDELRVDVAR